MEFLQSDIVKILFQLLPGFVSCLIIFNTTYIKPRNEFEYVVAALVFTAITQAFVYGIKMVHIWAMVRVHKIAEWDDLFNLPLSMAIAGVLGLIFAHLITNGKLYGLLIDKKISMLTGFPSEWYQLFETYSGFVILHLDDQRRIHGRIYDWPSEPNVGHFVLEDASWLVEEEYGYVRVPLNEDKFVVLDTMHVTMVELLSEGLKVVGGRIPKPVVEDGENGCQDSQRDNQFRSEMGKHYRKRKLRKSRKSGQTRASQGKSEPKGD